MTTTDLDRKLTESRKALEQKYIFPATIGLIVVLIIVWAGAKRFASDDYWMNLLTEGLGIAITILFIDRLNEYRAEKQLKRRLIREAGSRSRDTAVSALDWLRNEGWLTKNDEYPLLRDKKFKYSNWHEAFLEDIDLQDTVLEDVGMERARLSRANLRGTRLERLKMRDAVLQYINLQDSLCFHLDLRDVNLLGANLENANLSVCQMQRTELARCNMKNASIIATNLQKARFGGTDLRGADLIHSDLKDAQLHNVVFDETTRLPDGSYWNPDTDMARFTTPIHSDFWQRDWEKEQSK